MILCIREEGEGFAGACDALRPRLEELYPRAWKRSRRGEQEEAGGGTGEAFFGCCSSVCDIRMGLLHI